MCRLTDIQSCKIGSGRAISIEEETAIAELAELLIARRGFSITIESAEDHCAITIADAWREMRATGASFSEAWLDLELVSSEPTMAEILNQISAWCDLAAAAEAAETAPSRKDRAAYLAWLTTSDDDEIMPGEMVMSLPG